jgi:hypothetical protein
VRRVRAESVAASPDLSGPLSHVPGESTIRQRTLRSCQVAENDRRGRTRSPAPALG